jgi:DNA processing protein
VPGDVDRRHVAGCHALIRDGATLARHAADVLEALGRTALESAPGAPPCDPLARAILDALAAGECDLDVLAQATGASAPALLTALSLLEISGAVRSAGASGWSRAGML